MVAIDWQPGSADPSTAEDDRRGRTVNANLRDHRLRFRRVAGRLPGPLPD